MAREWEAPQFKKGAGTGTEVALKESLAQVREATQRPPRNPDEVIGVSARRKAAAGRRASARPFEDVWSVNKREISYPGQLL